MPKVVARDPAWLARPSPGFQLFNQDESSALKTPEVTSAGPLRKVAHRGTEVFVAVGNELRWSELGLLKNAGDDFERKNGRYGLQVDQGEEVKAERKHRVLKTPVARPIRQLSVSPSGEFIAIGTSHTVHIAVLPATSHLRSEDHAPLKLKAFQLGPTAHVLEQAPLVSMIWHPLSPTGHALLTVTQDACVRLWELDRENRSTFDEPALAVDLKKMGNATSTQDDLSASKYGMNPGFSPDSAEMQVAGACFGGQGRGDESGWASMTLWVAMTEGDVYALCPLLPNKWVATASMLPSLTTSVVAKARAISQIPDATQTEQRIADQQCRWLADVDAQDPILLSGGSDFDEVEVYDRPERPPAVPKLQGPFYVGSEMDIGEITDIFVIPPKTDTEALYDGDDYADQEDDGLSVGVVCIATSTSKIHICLDLDGVEAEWLPSKRSRTISLDDEDDKDLLLFETVDISHPDFDNEGWPTFTTSPSDRYEVFATTPSGVYCLNFRPWIRSLEDEVVGSTEEGVDFRVNVLVESSRTSVHKVVDMPAEPYRGINTAIALIDNSVGYLVLTAAMNVPFSALLDIPPHPYAPDPIVPPTALLPSPEPRAPYQPAEEFFARSRLPELLNTARAQNKAISGDLQSQVRFSPQTLQLMTEAHRILSTETHRLGLAAAELFRRLERMRAEMQEQVRRVKEAKQRVEAVVGEDEAVEDYEGDEGEEGEMLVGKDKMEVKVNESNERTVELMDRVERLRKKMAKLAGTDLSGKEKAFAEEVKRIDAELSPPPRADEDRNAGSVISLDSSSAPSSPEVQRKETLTSRLEAVHRMHEQLLQQANEMAERAAGDDSAGASTVLAGSEYRRRQMAKVRGLLEREAALVEGAAERLGRMGVGLGVS
jgi:nucleoporin NUP82